VGGIDLTRGDQPSAALGDAALKPTSVASSASCPLPWNAWGGRSHWGCAALRFAGARLDSPAGPTNQGWVRRNTWIEITVNGRDPGAHRAFNECAGEEVAFLEGPPGA
jgi:hypothetical protein